jgi:hypothetical protein
MVAVALLSGFQDIDEGEGELFNDLPPPEIVEQIAREVERLKHYH